MKIIIAGAGEVGYHLAKELSIENHDLTVIDINPAHLERVDTYSDVMVMQGSSTQIGLLESAHVEETDLVVAVTSSEAVNITTSILAKKLGAKNTIARISSGEYIDPKNIELFKSLGVDQMIYPEELAAIEVVKLIQRAAATDIIEFEGGKLLIVGLKLDKDSPILGKSLIELAMENKNIDFRVIAIHRAGKTFIPSGKNIFSAADQIFVISTQEGIENIISVSGKKMGGMQNIMILGGGKIGRKTAKMLENSVYIKLIESDPSKTQDLADKLEKALVIQGDGRDLDLLAQEGIVDMDGFIALTEDAETNIITCLMAKHLNVSKSIALVDNADYIPLTQTIGLDSMINKKLIAANRITKFIRRANIVSIATLQGIDAEVLEYRAESNSKITKRPIRELNFPENAILGGFIRGNDGYITVGDTHIQEGDRVIVIALPGAVSQVEKFF